MIKLILYELRKLWCKKAFLFGVMVLLFANFLLLFINSQVFPDVHANAYKTLLRELSGLSMEEKQDYVQEMYRRIDGIYTIDEIFRLENNSGISDYSRALRQENAEIFKEFQAVYEQGAYLKYTDNLWAEYNFLFKIKSELDAVADYSGYISGILDKADNLSQISIFKTESGDSFSEKSIQAQARTYSQLKNISTDYLPEAGVMSALEFRLSDILVIIFVLFASSVLLREEKDNGMLALAFTTPRGRGRTAAAKLAAVLLSLLACVCALYVMNLCYYEKLYGLGDLSRPIQSLPSLLSCPWELSLGEYLLIFMAAKWMGGIVVAVWLVLCTYLAKNIYTGWGLGLLFIGLNYAVRMSISGIGPWNLLRYINIFSFMNTNEVLGTAIQLYFFGDPVPILWAECIGGLVLFTGFSAAFIAAYQFGAGINLLGRSRNVGAVKLKLKFKLKPPQWASGRESKRLWRHEWYKLLKMNGTCWVILAFLIFLVCQSLQEPAYKSLEEEIYKDYMTRFGGRLTEDVAELIAKENERFEPLYELEDAYMLGLLSSAQYEAARSINGALLTEQGVFDRITGEKLNYIREHPSAWLVYDTGYEKLFDLENQGDIYEMMLLFLVLILGFGGMFSGEKMRGMENVLGVTPLGRRTLTDVKIKLCLRYGAALAALSLVPRYIYVGAGYGFPKLLAPAKSLEAFSSLPACIGIYHIMLLQLVFRILAAWSAVCVILWLSGRLKNTLTVFFAAAFLLELSPLLYMCSVSPMLWLSFWPLFHFPALLAENVPVVLLLLYGVLFLGLSVGARDDLMNRWKKKLSVCIRVLLCVLLVAGAAQTTSLAGEIRTSYFSVTDVSYGDGPVMAGKEFDCVITVRATDGDENIEGAVVTLKLPYGLSFADGNDRVFLGTLLPGKSYGAPFKLKADDNIRQTNCTVDVRLSGSSSRFGIPLETSESFQISVTPAERLEITNWAVPETINAAYDDGGGQFEFTLSNKGYVPVTDVEVSITGNGFEKQEPFYIEEMEPEAASNISMNLETREEGELEGKLMISYINILGEKKFLERSFSVTGVYNKPEMNHNVVIDPEMIAQEPVVPDWVWVPVTFGAIAGAVCLYKHKRLSSR